MRNRVKRVAFAEESLLKAFEKLQEGKFEEKELAKEIQSAIDELKENPFSGKPIQKNLLAKKVCFRIRD